MRIEDIERVASTPINNHTKCSKMTDESSSVKNGINGASIVNTIHVSRNNNLDSGTGSSELYKSGDRDGLQSVSGAYFKEECEDYRVQVYRGNALHSNAAELKLINNTTDLPLPHCQGVGGRLQFFKDGKFILELARAREGEKGGWVSVPRKTYWSSSTSTTGNCSKNESSASLSFSDDNSSVQSSPWQRDHCWKQTSPKKGISKEMNMMFKRTKGLKISRNGYKIAKIKRRRPYDVSVCKMPFILLKNGFNSQSNDGSDDGTRLKKETDKVNETTNRNIDCQNEKTVNEIKCKAYSQVKLTVILQKLIDRLSIGLFPSSKATIHASGTISHFSSSSSRITDHHHHQHVSPRKRILRELEKVSIEDNKRSRAKAVTVNSSPSIATTVSVSSTTTQNTSNFNKNVQSYANSNDQNVSSASNTTRSYSSYSIHSLLGHTSSNSSKTQYKHDSTSTYNVKEKESDDASYFKNAISSPKSHENGVTAGISFPENKRKSPNINASQQEVHCHRNSSESMMNYEIARTPEVNHISENNLNNRFKHFNCSSALNLTSSSFHPYLSSPKYSSCDHISLNSSIDNHKTRTGGGGGGGGSSSSPIYAKNATCSRSSAFYPSPQSSKSLHGLNTTNSTIRLRESSPCDVSPSSLEHREVNISSKKATTSRQQFSSLASLPSVTQGDTSTYKTGIDQKRKNTEERILSPESTAYHKSAADMNHVAVEVLRSSSVLPHSPLFYLYPPHGSPGPHTSTSSSYIPPISYYHPYAAAVAAFRNPLWMHYQAGVMSSVAVQPRISSSIFPYSDTAGTVLPSSLLPSRNSLHLSSPPVGPWSSFNRESSLTDDPVTLVTIKDELNSDVPLNLSKH